MERNREQQPSKIKRENRKVVCVCVTKVNLSRNKYHGEEISSFEGGEDEEQLHFSLVITSSEELGRDGHDPSLSTTLT